MQEHTFDTEQWLFDSLSNVYGERTNKIIQCMTTPSSRYYLRFNSLTHSPYETIHDMSEHGIQVYPDAQIHDAGYIQTQFTKVDQYDRFVEADLFAAEAVSQGAHLYASGVKKCQGLRIGSKVSIIDPYGTIVGSGEAIQNETSILTYRKGIAVRVDQNPSGLPSFMETPWYIHGDIHLQSFPAIVTSHVLAPQPGETIIDLNCAPAGKMSHVSQLTQNEARVIGFDRNSRKLERAKQTLERLHCSNYSLILHDSRYVDLDYNLKADRILVDPPCSALGVIPKLSIRKKMNDIPNLASYQKQFLTVASKIVKPRGTIVYSVCTITRQECEEVVEFGESKLHLKTVEALPFVGGPGIEPYGMSQRFHPDTHGSGFFIARFMKT